MKPKNMSALVSIIVPVYNNQIFVKKCLLSILNQSYNNIEVVVVDDGSTDASAEIIKNVIINDNRFIFIQQENQGVASARNVALENAHGDYYLFVDGDDYIGEKYVQDFVECAESNDSDLVICGYTLVYDKKRNKVIIPGNYKKGEREEWAYRISAVCSRLYRSEYWKKHDLKFVKEEGARAEDVPLAMFANATANNIQVIEKADYFYIQHKESAMHRGKFLFPYNTFEDMYKKIILYNADDVFFKLGVLKFLAHFGVALYRDVDKQERIRFYKYINNLFGEDYSGLLLSWKENRKKVQYSIIQKIAIEVFIYKTKNNYLNT